MSLDQWQKKLEEQFKLLYEVRKETSSKNPVFALEHGLNTSDIEHLKADVRAHIALQEPLDSHWLPWVVYAAEIGYGYDGHEYWQTFESNTSGWVRLGYPYRGWIRKGFLKFRDQFHGAEPSGPWAKHFKYICWPIRHAILPRDLQHQLAKALFDLRLFFREELFESPSLLGNFISAHCRIGTKRFLQLMEDPALVGQISFALLLHKEKISEDLLLKETQARIVADLSREQRERQWLENAQRHAVTKHEGLRRYAYKGESTIPRGRSPRLDDELLRIENTPRLFIRPESSMPGWEVKLELQDLTSLVTRFPDLRPIIAENYSYVVGTSGSSQARGIFLRPGPHSFTLVRWPSSNEILISFVSAPEKLNAFLRLEHLFPPGNVHLFNISSEKIAYEIRGRNIRPGEKYVVLSASPIPHDGVIFKPFNINCDGIYSAYLETPGEITSYIEEAAKAVGLSCTKSLRVWPVGLPAKEWDGEGYGVWVEGDSIRVGLRAGYELRGVEVSINDDFPSFFEIQSSSEGPVFLYLSPLPVGENIVEIKAVAKHQPHDDLVGYITVVIKEPQVWDIKTANQGALRGYVDPENPSLEEIWANDINFALVGPAGRPLKCRFRLLDKLNAKVIREKQILGMTLPIYGQQWRNEFSTKIKKDTSMQEAYEVAYFGEIIVDAEEVGYFTIKGERRSTPIRWIIQTSGHHKRLQYINETADDNLEIERYKFSTPDVLSSIDKRSLGQALEDTEGGLFLIQNREGFRDTIVVTASGRAMGLGDMKVFPKLHNAYEGDTGIEQLISLYGLWAKSKTSGSLFAELWRTQVLKSIASKISADIGGARWATAERNYLERDDERNFIGLKTCISDRPGERYIGVKLEGEAKRLSQVSMRERVIFFGDLFKNFLRISEKIPDADSPWPDPEFVLKLSSAPHTLLMWDQEKTRAFISFLRKFPMMSRASRYLVIAVERYCATDPNWEGCCHNGWRW